MGLWFYNFQSFQCLLWKMMYLLIFGVFCNNLWKLNSRCMMFSLLKHNTFKYCTRMLNSRGIKFANIMVKKSSQIIANIQYYSFEIRWKSEKIWHPKETVVIILKFEKWGFTIERWVQKMQMAVSVDCDQNSPLGAIWSRFYTVCPVCLSENMESLQKFLLAKK